jgi:hypothetical protein
MTFQVDMDHELIRADIISGQYRPKDKSYLSDKCIISQVWPNEPPSRQLSVYVTLRLPSSRLKSYFDSNVGDLRALLRREKY